MTSRTGWRTRLAAVGIMAATVAGGLTLGGGTPAAATTTQTSSILKPNNYSGPNCPGVTWNCTTDPNVIQDATPTGGENRFEATALGGTAVQKNTTGPNNFACNISSTAASATLVCDATQSGNGGNTITADEQAAPSTGAVNIANVVQSSTVKLFGSQSSADGPNTVTATHTVNQTANSILDATTPVTHTQNSFELAALSQVATGAGANKATLTLNRTQSSSATGASPTQKQDTTPLGADPNICGGAAQANGNACVYQRSDSGTNNLTVRAKDTKSATANALLGSATATQGVDGGGWLIRPDIDSAHNPSGGIVDLGTPPAPGGDCTVAPGIIKVWTMAGSAGTRAMNDLIQIPIIGQSPYKLTANSCAKLTAPNGTKEFAHMTVDGHCKHDCTGALTASLQSDQTVSNRVDYSAQDVHASLTCSQNSPNTCSSVSPSGTNVEATEGAPFSGQVATFTDANKSDTPEAFTATIDWGDGTDPSAGTVSGGNGSFAVAGAHTYADEGTHTVKTTVTNVSDPTVKGTASSTATTADAPLTGTAKTLSSQTAGFSGVVASFADANPGNHLADYTASINWGDGNTSAGTIAGNEFGGYDVSGSHTYASPGNYTIATTVGDVGGASAGPQSTLQTSSITVTGTGLSSGEGAASSGPVATFTDPNPADGAADFTATIAWGDNSSSVGTISGGAGSFTVSGGHTYADEGSYTATVTVTSTHDPKVTGSGPSTATIGDAPIAASGKSGLYTAAGASFSGVVATVTDANPGATATDFTTAPGGVTINWGDNTSSAGTVAANGSGFDVSGSHTYTTGGANTITVTVTDKGGSTATTTTTLQSVACAAGGCFSIGSSKAAVGTAVTWWSRSWASKNPGTGAPSDYYGFENSHTAPTCGTNWTSSLNDDGRAEGTQPPASVPAYMLVVVTGKVTDQSDTPKGNTVKMVIVKTNPGYAQPGPHNAPPPDGKQGTGTVVATICG